MTVRLLMSNTFKYEVKVEGDDRDQVVQNIRNEVEAGKVVLISESETFVNMAQVVAFQVWKD